MNKITQIEKTIRQTDRHRHTGRQAGRDGARAGRRIVTSDGIAQLSLIQSIKGGGDTNLSLRLVMSTDDSY